LNLPGPFQINPRNKAACPLQIIVIATVAVATQFRLIFFLLYPKVYPVMKSVRLKPQFTTQKDDREDRAEKGIF
jgi:hypothetical protein